MTTPEPQQPNTPLSDTKLVEDRSKLSKMYQHYVDMKDKYPHALLLYRTLAGKMPTPQEFS
jgi:DNA mismatch repair protein MutS